MNENFTALDLERALTDAVGVSNEEDGYEWYEEYTGLNGFYHLLAGTGHGTANRVGELTTVHKNGDSVTVDGLGVFSLMKYSEENFDTYEKSWDNFLVFEFEGRYFRVQGWLDSHAGGVWDGSLHEVRPVEKTITVWEEK